MECARECGIHRRRRSVESSSEVEAAQGSSKRGHTTRWVLFLKRDSSHQVPPTLVRGISPARQCTRSPCCARQGIL